MGSAMDASVTRRSLYSLLLVLGAMQLGPFLFNPLGPVIGDLARSVFTGIDVRRLDFAMSWMFLTLQAILVIFFLHHFKICASTSINSEHTEFSFDFVYVAISIASGVMLSILNILLLALIRRWSFSEFGIGDETRILLLHGKVDYWLLLIFLFAICTAAWLEERVFRGIMMRQLAGVPILLAAVLSIVSWCWLHAMNGHLLHSLFLIPSGTVFFLIMIFLGHYKYSALTHVTSNAMGTMINIYTYN